MLDSAAFDLLTKEYRLILATEPEEFDAVKSLRKEVLLSKYRNFATIEDEEQFAWDKSDEQSFIFLIQHQQTQRYVGTIRVFYINCKTPIQTLPMEHYTHTQRDPSLLPVCEISRFALSRDLPLHSERSALWVRTHLSLLLMIGTRITAQIYPFKMIYAIMEQTLARLLRRQHAHFEQIGESVDYYGECTPFAIEPEKLLKETQETEVLSRYYLQKFIYESNTIDKYLSSTPYLTAAQLQLNRYIPQQRDEHQCYHTVDR